MINENSKAVTILFVFKELLLGISLFSFFTEINSFFVIFSVGVLYCISEILDYIKGYRLSLHAFYITTIIFLFILVSCWFFNSLTEFLYGATLFFIGNNLGLHLSGKNTHSQSTSEKGKTKKESDIRLDDFKIIFRSVLSFVYMLSAVILIKFVLYDYIYSLRLLQEKIFAIIILFAISFGYIILALCLERKLLIAKDKNMLYTAYDFWLPASLFIVVGVYYFFSINYIKI